MHTLVRSCHLSHLLNSIVREGESDSCLQILVPVLAPFGGLFHVYPLEPFFLNCLYHGAHLYLVVLPWKITPKAFLSSTSLSASSWKWPNSIMAFNPL